MGRRSTSKTPSRPDDKGDEVIIEESPIRRKFKTSQVEPVPIGVTRQNKKQNSADKKERRAVSSEQEVERSRGAAMRSTARSRNSLDTLAHGMSRRQRVAKKNGNDGVADDF